ncbi:hypothetical protein WA158_004166 [Blastocystis sp. Blastoise]
MQSAKNSVFIIEKESPDKGYDLKTLQFVTFNTDKSSNQYLYTNDTFFLVNKATSVHPNSWFLNETIVKDGSIYLASIIHPLFLAIPYLMKNLKFVQLDQLLIDKDGNEIKLLSKNCQLIKTLPAICDVKDLGDDMKFYRINESKLYIWLEKKVNKVSQALLDSNIRDGIYKEENRNDESIKHKCFIEAYKIMSIYISEDVFNHLKDSLKITDEELYYKEIQHMEYNQNSATEKQTEKSPQKGTKRKPTISDKDKKKTKSIMSFFS